MRYFTYSEKGIYYFRPVSRNTFHSNSSKEKLKFHVLNLTGTNIAFQLLNKYLFNKVSLKKLFFKITHFQ